MARTRTVHRCTDCGATSPRWSGRCPGCGAWNTLVEELVTPTGPGSRAGGTDPGRGGNRLGGWSGGEGRPGGGDHPVLIGDVDQAGSRPLPTHLDELDRVLGGGLVRGSVTLVAGEPGIGKSTVLLQAAGAMAEGGERCLMVSAEESKAQVRSRAARVRALAETLWVVSETCLPDVMAGVSEVEPDVLVVDSVQALFDPALESAPGSVAQVRHCAHRLAEAARSAPGTAVVLVGHVTKDGSVAGPRVLEHLVDTVLTFEGDRHHALRMLRAVKHRFGATGELGLFEMTPTGLLGVADPSSLLLADRRPGTPGAAVLPAMEGGRPMLVEVQALVMDGTDKVPSRRAVQGLDPARLPMLLAVLEQRGGCPLADKDVYTSVVGGVKVTEPAADLAVMVALLSAKLGRPVDQGMVVFGEVGLGGEVRQVANPQRRLAEAARLGFTTALVPRSTPDGPTGLELIRVGKVVEAAHLVAAGR